MVEDVFKNKHNEQLEILGNKSYLSPHEAREIDGKMDKKAFLDYASKLVYM